MLYVIVALAVTVGLSAVLSWWRIRRRRRRPELRHRTRRDPYSQVKHHSPRDHWVNPDE